MARLHRRGDVWFCSYYDATGKRQRRTTHCTSKRAAQAFADGLELRAHDPAHAAAHSATLRSAVKTFLEQCKVRGKAAGTIKMHTTKAGHLLRIIGDATPLPHLTAKVIDDYTAQRTADGAQASTIGKELSTLRGTLKLARRHSLFPHAVEAVMPERWQSASKPKERALAPSEAQALFRELTADRQAHVAFLIGTACRWEESERARLSDIDLTSERVRIRGTKTDLARATIPVVGFAHPMLEHVLKIRAGVTGPLFRPWGNVRRDLAQACRRAGIAKVTPNDLRRTHATWLRLHGVEPHLIAGVLRHKDSRMVERVYGRLSPDALGKVLRDRLGETRDTRGTDASAPGGDSGHHGKGQLVGIAQNYVPRDGIEPPTRGFSIPEARREYRGKDHSSRVALGHGRDKPLRLLSGGAA